MILIIFGGLMKIRDLQIVKQFMFFLLLLVCNAISFAYAAAPAQAPLYIGVTAAKPNIMLMIDSSGSMSNTVTTTHEVTNPGSVPSNFTYNCPTSNRLSGGVTPPGSPTNTIFLTVSSTGTVQVCTTNTCSKTATFGTRKKGKCFNNTQKYQVAYYNQGPLSGGPYIGLTLNWYFSTGSFAPGSLTTAIKITSTRSAIAKQAAIDLIDSLTPDSGAPSTVRMGLSRYNGSDGGLLLSEIKDLNLTQAKTLKSQVDNIPTSDYTPLATTLSDIGKYFATGETGNLTLHPSTTKTSASVDSVFSKANGTTSHSIRNSTGTSPLVAPILGYCQKSFLILISDGLPNGDREISPLLRDYTGDCATKNLCISTPDNNINLPGASSGPPLTSTGTLCNSGNPTQWYNKACKNGTKAGRIYETGGSDYLDDVAQALYEMDLRPSLDSSKKIQNKIKNNVVTYAIGLADTSLQQQSVLSDAAAVGGGKFYFAEDADALASALDDTISDLSSKVGSSSSVAANSSNLSNQSIIYQAKFDSSNWTGILSAFPLGLNEDINGNGILDVGEDTNGNGKLDVGSIASKIWNAAELIPAFASRNILTFNPNKTSTNKGAVFTCSELSAIQKSILGILNCSDKNDNGLWRLNYLRGDASHELINPNRKDTDIIRTGGNLIFRNRTYLDKITGNALIPDPWVLGDIVNSDPVFVGSEDYGYDKLPGSEGSTYKAFITGKKDRRTMLYIGANDGMLHGFDGNITNLDAGKEIFSYVPNAVYGQLLSLSSPNYNHLYSVDGSPRAGDAYFTSDNNWHTVLLGSTGAGGKALFALDITNPSTFNSNNVLWEISDTNSIIDSDLNIDTSVARGFANNLGYTIPQPSIARMQDGSWVAIVANGYDSLNKLAVLYIIDISTGHLIKAIDTQAGSSITPNGLSTPIIVDSNNDKKIDSIYAGDLLGNLWKFDVSSSTSSNWQIANNGSPLFIACTDPSNCNSTRQPITAKPQVGNVDSLQTSGSMVYFGTGKYFEDIDNNVNNAQTQSFYAIWDNNISVSKSSLQSQRIIAEVISGENNVRATTDTLVNYPTAKGWYMDLLNPSTATSIGERIVSASLLRHGNIIFVTLLPIPPSGAEICGSGSDGTSWLMELDAITGKRLGTSTGGAPWDINDDGVINSGDLVMITVGSLTGLLAPSAIQSPIGIVDTPNVIDIGGSKEIKIFSGSKEGEIWKILEAGGAGNKPKRESWRQIFQ
jgi:type IV pilus assembly protein PilY1